MRRKERALVPHSAEYAALFRPTKATQAM